MMSTSSSTQFEFNELIRKVLEQYFHDNQHHPGASAPAYWLMRLKREPHIDNSSGYPEGLRKTLMVALPYYVLTLKTAIQRDSASQEDLSAIKQELERLKALTEHIGLFGQERFAMLLNLSIGLSGPVNLSN